MVIFGPALLTEFGTTVKWQNILLYIALNTKNAISKSNERAGGGGANFRKVHCNTKQSNSFFILMDSIKEFIDKKHS